MLTLVPLQPLIEKETSMGGPYRMLRLSYNIIGLQTHTERWETNTKCKCVFVGSILVIKVQCLDPKLLITIHL